MIAGNLEQVVLQGCWVDEDGWGVQDPITVDPVPLDGQGVVPNLRDLSSSTFIRTKPRQVVPDYSTGYFAVRVVASNDPDVDGYGGRRITFAGYDPFVIQVPYNAPLVTVTDNMANHLPDLTVGSQVRAMWLADAAIAGATPQAPQYFFTAEQTSSLIERYTWRPRGEWQSATGYLVRDVVSLEGSSWLARQPSTGTRPGSDDTVWQALANISTRAPALPEAGTTTATKAVSADLLPGRTARYILAAATTQPVPKLYDGMWVAVIVSSLSTASLTLTLSGSDVIGEGSAQSLVLAPSDVFVGRAQNTSGVMRLRRMSAAPLVEQPVSPAAAQALAGKADASALTQGLASKADSAATTQALAAKANIADVPGMVKSVVREYTANASNVVPPTGFVGAYVTAISGGQSGGSGRRGAAGTARGGGGAGAVPGVVDERWVPASLWGSAYSVVVGAGAAGGAAAAADDTNGNPGVAGGSTSIATGVVTLRASSGAAPGGGSTTGGAAGAAGSPSVNPGAAGAGGTNSVGANATAGYNSWNGGPSGGGGSISTADVPYNGGAGAPSWNWGQYATAAGGVVDGAAPAASPALGPGVPGGGQGGGAASKTQAAQAGADGVGYGSPGAGGGASLNGYNSGRGGNAGPGYARITFVFA